MSDYALKRRLVLACLLIVSSSPALSKTYSTEFDAVELPISESGVWTNVGQDWTPVGTANGIAYGTHRATGYNDSYAHLSGFSPDQVVEATIYKTGDFDRNQEVELHLRWADSAHNARGYEVLIEAKNRYAYIVRWNGPLGDFTILSSPSTFRLPRSPATGDVLKAQIVGDVITVFFNGAEVGRISDSTWKTGNPGIGFYSSDPTGEPNSRFGFTSFSASDYEDSTVRPGSPTALRAD